MKPQRLSTPRRAPRRRRTLAALLAGLLALPAPWPAVQAQVQAQMQLPALGENASDDLSVGNERRIGDQIMREIRADPDYLDDPVLQDYLGSLWRPLVEAARRNGEIEPDVDRQFAWESFLVRDRAVNAFALPGGYVGVYLGMIAVTPTADELASVLGHELTHVTQRHIARSIAGSQRASMIGLATMVLGILAAARSNNPDVAQAAIAGGQAAAIQGQLNYSRDMEREADRIGFRTMTSAGFAAAGMADMFEKLQGANRLNDSNEYPYLRSHPLTIERMSEARSRTMLAGSGADVPTLRSRLMQARARVLMDGSVPWLQQQTEQLAAARTGRELPAADRIATLYGGALAAVRLRDHARAAAAIDEAQSLAATLRPREPAGERELQLLDAEARVARGDSAGALRVLDALAPAGEPRAPMLLRARAAYARADDGGAARRASVDALQTWLADHPRDALAWATLGSVTEVMGLRLRSLRAQAEAHAASGDLIGAIDRLRSAQRLGREVGSTDFIEASVIDARLRALEAQRRERLAEARANGIRGDDLR